MRAQEKVLKEMKSMGMTEEQINSVGGMGINITENFGYSTLNEKNILVSSFQTIRKSLDYIKVFGDEIPLEQIVRGRLESTIGHELGHKVNDVARIAVNRIAPDAEWDKNSENGENRMERFAEFWAGVSAGDDARLKQMREREWLVQLRKVRHLWDALENYNNNHEQKADLYSIFRDIEGKLDPKDLDVTALFQARRTFYGGNAVENYASPYSRDIVAKAVKPLEPRSKLQPTI